MVEEFGYTYLGLRTAQLGFGWLQEKILYRNFPFKECFNSGIDRRIGAALTEEAILGSTALTVKLLAGAAKSALPQYNAPLEAIETVAGHLSMVAFQSSLINLSAGLLMREGNRLFGSANIIRLAGEGLTDRATRFFNPIYLIGCLLHKDNS